VKITMQRCNVVFLKEFGVALRIMALLTITLLHVMDFVDI